LEDKRKAEREEEALRRKMGLVTLLTDLSRRNINAGDLNFVAEMAMQPGGQTTIEQLREQYANEPRGRVQGPPAMSPEESLRGERLTKILGSPYRPRPMTGKAPTVADVYKAAVQDTRAQIQQHYGLALERMDPTSPEYKRLKAQEIDPQERKLLTTNYINRWMAQYPGNPPPQLADVRKVLGLKFAAEAYAEAVRAQSGAGVLPESPLSEETPGFSTW